MLVLPTFNVIRLIYITTGLFAAFIATTLLIYGLSDARACPVDWKPDTYENCSIWVGLKIPDLTVKQKNKHPGSNTSGVQVTLVSGGRGVGFEPRTFRL
jgi:hypothetical protein